MKRVKLGQAMCAGLLLLLLLASCGLVGGGSSQQAASQSEEANIPVIAPVPEPVEEPEPVYPYVNPLTGEGRMEDISNKRPIAVMFNNLEKALPQLGVGQADVIYEIVAEGGITRMMALYQDLEGVGDLGSIRSARDYYVNLAYGHDAIYIHAGGSPQAYEAIKGWGVSAIDFVNGPYGDMCWRDPERRANAGYEHSLLTSSENILAQMPSQFRQEHKEGYEVGWTFDEEVPVGGTAAVELTVPFSTYKTGYFTYDEASGQYAISQHINGKDREYVDGGTGQAVQVSNVLVLYTDVSIISGDDAGRMSVRTTGDGEGVFFRDGQVYPITWRRDSKSSCYEFLGEGGGEIVLKPGASYVNVVKTSAEVEWN